jgi:hypothetical protein
MQKDANHGHEEEVQVEEEEVIRDELCGILGDEVDQAAW